MQKGKAFVVVGHSNWGKSRTLRELTDSVHKKWIRLSGDRVFVKRMSNDDKPDDLKQFIDSLDPAIKNIIIIALCPNFEEPKRKTLDILKVLQGKYRPYFFVLKKKYNRRYLGRDKITDEEIEKLKPFGMVYIEHEREGTKRARSLKLFIESQLGWVATAKL